MPRLSSIAFFICFCISFSFAQDTAKKNNQTPAPAPVHQVIKPSHIKYHLTKADSARLKPSSTAVTAPKPDNVTPQPAVNKSLRDQYLFFLNKIYHYQQPDFADFWKSASDTLKQFRNKQKEASLKILRQIKTIDSLQMQSAAKDQKLAAKVDEINLFGISVPLLTYNLIVWGIVVFLVIITFSVIARISSFRNEAHYRVKLYGELEEEFKAYKAKANDKEKKLARELQTERNKLDELLGRG